DLDTIGSTNLDARFDLLWETAGVHGRPGLVAIPSTYHTFGNDGSVPLHQSIDYPGNTALPNLPNRLEVLHDLARVCSDHLPALQNYQIVRRPGLSLRGEGSESADPLPGAFSLASAPGMPPHIQESESRGFEGSLTPPPQGTAVPVDGLLPGD